MTIDVFDPFGPQPMDRRRIRFTDAVGPEAVDDEDGEQSVGLRSLSERRHHGKCEADVCGTSHDDKGGLPAATRFAIALEHSRQTPHDVGMSGLEIGFLRRVCLEIE